MVIMEEVLAMDTTTMMMTIVGVIAEVILHQEVD